jgi:hypothetical protein
MPPSSFSDKPERGRRTGWKADYPNVPKPAPSSPGQQLAVRLTAPGLMIAGILGGLVVLAVCSGFLAMPLVGLFQAGEGGFTFSGWPLMVYVVVLALFWLLIFRYLVHQVRQSLVGKPVVEISDHPLWPGQTYRLVFHWSGAPRLQKMSLSLVCQEEARYRQGTDTQVEKKVVHVQHLWARHEASSDQSLPAEVPCEFLVPQEAMHSFEAKNNQVVWMIQVKGHFQRWGEFDHQFPLVVLPPRPPEART